MIAGQTQHAKAPTHVPTIALPDKFLPACGCIVLAFAGGFVANHFNVPLAFMLGAIAVTMTAAIAGAPIARPSQWVVHPMRSALGVLLGSTVTPELLDRIGALGGAMLLVPLFVVTAGIVGAVYYHRVARYSREEAFFCALPGGLAAMTTYAEEMGVDIRRVSLAHALRITFVVLLAPLAVGLLAVLPDIDVTQSAASITDIAPTDLALLFVAGVVGYFAARRLGLPGGQMVGPMIASAILHVTGITGAKPPVELVIASQVIIGAYIGSRYVGETLSMVGSAIALAFGHVSIMLVIAASFAWVLLVVFDVPLITGMLSFAPGGMSEIGLIALGLGLDVGFVATIQVSRLLTIALFAPWAFRRLRQFLQ